jgi:hypothetical protein
MKLAVTMSFMDAVNAMIGGSRCIRQSWTSEYACILPGQNFIWLVLKDTPNSTNSSIYIPSINDILAHDWVVKT